MSVWLKTSFLVVLALVVWFHAAPLSAAVSYGSGLLSDSAVAPIARVAAQTTVAAAKAITNQPLRSVVAATEAILFQDIVPENLDSRSVSGQPLPGALLTLLLGAGFAAALRKRMQRETEEEEEILSRLRCGGAHSLIHRKAISEDTYATTDTRPPFIAMVMLRL